MNKQDRKDMIELKMEMKNVSKAVEKIATNDIPHIQKAVNYIKGILFVSVPLNIALLFGLVAVALKIAGVY